MRIKVNGEDIDRDTRITINANEGSDLKAWLVIIGGALLAIGWWLLWI